MQKISLKVEGMKCGGCENRVKNAVGAVDGVKSVDASYKDKIVNVVAEDSASVDEVKEVIADLGFEIV
jgi:copper chaperone CopZ